MKAKKRILTFRRRQFTPHYRNSTFHSHHRFHDFRFTLLLDVFRTRVQCVRLFVGVRSGRRSRWFTLLLLAFGNLLEIAFAQRSRTKSVLFVGSFLLEGATFFRILYYDSRGRRFRRRHLHRIRVVSARKTKNQKSVIRESGRLSM